MNAFALHLPEKRGLSRWTLAGLIILMAHAAIVAAVALWYARQPSPEPTILPAIAVTLAPVEASSPEMQDQNIAVGPTMQQAEAAPQQPPKEEKPVEQVVQPPSPPQEAEVTLPKDEPKQVEKPTESQPPAPETRAPPKTEHVAQFSEAASNAYDALVLGHLERFIRYPAAARGAVGRPELQFVLNSAGAVVDCTLTKSSGDPVLDREAIDIIRRASPFPAFPAAKPVSQAVYTVPINFFTRSEHRAGRKG